MWNLAKSFFFRFDAEDAHHFVLNALERAWPMEGSASGFVQRNILSILAGKTDFDASVTCSGLKFRNPLGLAAGFDKDGRILGALSALGYGFAEVGTVTPRPQPGNPRPRLFREVSQQGLFNSMGFNNEGADVVARRLLGWKASGKLAKNFRVGINFGKNRATALEEAHRDYSMLSKAFKDAADYVVINVSSPNTPGLKDLQSKEKLLPIVKEVKAGLAQWTNRPPLFLKLSPELTQSDLESLIPAAEEAGIDGWILTNTLQGTFVNQKDTLKGGWSGAPLQKHSIECFQRVRMLSHRPLISVGGIMTVDDAKDRMKMGAHLIQIYTGWIFGGPRFPSKIISALQELKQIDRVGGGSK